MTKKSGDPPVFTRGAVVERHEGSPARLPPRPQEKIAIELPFREWSRIADQLEHLSYIYNEAGARADVKRENIRAFSALEIGYNKTTGRWDLG